MTTENGVLGLLQRVDTTGDPYLLQFDFDWLTSAGSLQVHVNDVLAMTVGADGSVLSGLGTPVTQSLGDLTRVSLEFTPAEFTDPPGGYIRFDLHPGSEATIQIDNISFAPVTTTTPLPGDIDEDGDVDRRDAALFVSHLGLATGSTWNTGDFNDDGATTLVDLALLQTHLGPPLATSPGTRAEIPEPTSAVLAMLALAAAIGSRVMRSSRFQ
ncbi:MAG: dockerin type I domain-containing protein, partial [Pirellulales bacterium]